MPLGGDLVAGQKIESNQALGDGQPGGGRAAGAERIEQLEIGGAGPRIPIAVQKLGIFSKAGNVARVSLGGLRQQRFGGQRVAGFEELAGTVERLASERYAD